MKLKPSTLITSGIVAFCICGITSLELTVRIIERDETESRIISEMKLQQSKSHSNPQVRDSLVTEQQKELDGDSAEVVGLLASGSGLLLGVALLVVGVRRISSQ